MEIVRDVKLGVKSEPSNHGNQYP